MGNDVVEIIGIGENAASITDRISQSHDDEDAGVSKSIDGNTEQNANISKANNTEVTHASKAEDPRTSKDDETEGTQKDLQLNNIVNADSEKCSTRKYCRCNDKIMVKALQKLEFL